MNVLSLFDGISCGQIALERAGIKYDNYFASEIDKYAIKVTQHNYPNTIQLGDVAKVKGSGLPKIDIVIGGSPCQDLSLAKTNGVGLLGKRSGLFYEFVRVLKETNPRFFLLENVIMKSVWRDVITKELGVEPIQINSNLVSCQNRRRYYWTNIPKVVQPNDKHVTIQDVIHDDTYKVFTNKRITETKRKTKNYIQWDISGKGYSSQANRAYFKSGKICTVPKQSPSDKLNIVLDYENDIYRKSHPIEVERYQTVPDNYTLVDGVSTSRRLGLLGDGWTVDVIAHVFSFMEL